MIPILLMMFSHLILDLSFKTLRLSFVKAYFFIIYKKSGGYFLKRLNLLEANLYKGFFAKANRLVC